MTPSRDLAARFEAYGDWRRRLSAGISRFHEWLRQQELSDAQIDLKIAQTIERLQQDKLIVAFVAEFSRGKSELINAIFFADFGQRLLPSSAGRTTMCPTSSCTTRFARHRSGYCRLKRASRTRRLPSSRITPTSGRRIPSICRRRPKCTRALSRVSQVKHVPTSLARKFGLHIDGAESKDATESRRDRGSAMLAARDHQFSASACCSKVS
jgi:hypothetical protein